MGSLANPSARRTNARNLAQRRVGQRTTSGGSTRFGGNTSSPRRTSSGNTSGGGGFDFSSFIPSTQAGGFASSAFAGIQGLMQKFPKNKAIQSFGIGLLGNYLDTMGNTGLEIARNDAFMSKMGEYQSGLENLKTGNTLKLMGAEGAIAGELIGRQGIEARAGIRETGEQERFNLRETGNQTLRLRGDARGAIRSQGARFYG